LLDIHFSQNPAHELYCRFALHEMAHDETGYTVHTPRNDIRSFPNAGGQEIAIEANQDRMFAEANFANGAQQFTTADYCISIKDISS